MLKNELRGPGGNLTTRIQEILKRAKKENGFFNKVKVFFTKAFPQLHKFIKSIIGKIKTVFRKFKSAINESKSRVRFKTKIKAFLKKLFFRYFSQRKK